MEPTERRRNRIEVFATIVLAVAAVGTAWSTYQSARWRGDQASHTGRATAAHVASSESNTRAGQQSQIDVATFIQWVDANAKGDTKLATFYRQRFRDEFQPAFDAWLATDPFTNPSAPPTPFAMPQYRLAETTEGARANVAAGREAKAASNANQRADDYMLAVVLLAAALFFAGISTKMQSTRQREVLVGLGGLFILAAVAWLVTLPISLK